MKFISDSNELTKKFKSLCQKYSHYKWAVAWAGNPVDFDLGKLLKINKEKIENIVVGLHFCQTSPIFIEDYIDDARVRFYLQSDGTFHPKVYLFYNSDNDWSAIVGSSNFTSHGFHLNDEANVMFGSDDSGVSFSQVSDYISSLWNKAEAFDMKQLERYKVLFRFQSKKHASLKKVQSLKNRDVTSLLDVYTWEDYYSQITTQDIHLYETRIALLNKANELFKTETPFNSFSPDVRRALAGFITETKEVNAPGVDWRLFGSMKGAGTFKHAINNKIKIGKALDAIPLEGTVTKQMFENYCKAFEGWNNPIACATRLLAIKRPDLFVCINSKNRAILSKLLGVPVSRLTLENYWEEVLQRIYGSAWYQDKSHLTKGIEKDTKRFQVAMLDSISYRSE